MQNDVQDDLLCDAKWSVWLGGIVVPSGIGLATGDRGFNPSRCTVKCDLGQVVHTHCPAPLKLQPYGTI